MSVPNSTRCCRHGASNQLAVRDERLDRFERGVLEVMRHYFSTFAVPQSQAWMRAMEVAFLHFPESTAAMTSLRVLDVVQTMRRSRSSIFNFSSPTCPYCAGLLTDAERHLMATIQCVRSVRMGEAETHAMLLCEGNDARDFLTAVGVLVKTASDRVLYPEE